MPQSGLLQSAMVSLYVLYLTWSAVSNSPQDECKPAGFLPRSAFIFKSPASFIQNQYLIHQLPLEILFNDVVAARTQLWHRVFRPPQLHLARRGKRTHTSPPSPLLGLLSGSSVSSTHPSPPQDRYNSHNRKATSIEANHLYLPLIL